MYFAPASRTLSIDSKCALYLINNLHQSRVTIYEILSNSVGWNGGDKDAIADKNSDRDTLRGDDCKSERR